MKALRALRLTIRAKVLLLALGLAWPPLIFVSLLGLSSLNQARDIAVHSVTTALQKQAEANLEKRAADKAQLYNTTLAHVQQQVEGMTASAAALFAAGPPPSTNVGRVWASPNGLTPEVSRDYGLSVARARQVMPLLHSVVQSNPLVSLGYIGLEDGGVLAFDHDIIDVLIAIKPFDARQRSWYVAARDSGHSVWVDTYVDANTKKLTTTCATPIYDAQGVFVGVVGFDLLLDTIQRDLLKLDMGDQGYAFLINERGQVLVRPDLQVGTLSWNQSFIGENLLQTHDTRLHDAVQRMTRRQQGIEQLFYQGGNVYLAYAPIPAAGWSVGIVIPEAEVIQAAEQVGLGIGRSQRQLGTQVLISFIFGMIGIAALGAVLSRQLTNPLRRLRHGAHRIAEGDLDYRMSVTSDDEIGELVQSFNTMADALREKLAELESNLRQLAMLNEVSNRFKAVLSLPELLQAIPDAACNDLGFDRAVLYLLEGQSLQAVSACFGPDADEQVKAFLLAANAEPPRIDSETVEADVVRSGQAVIVANPWEHPRVVRAKQQIARSESYVQVPIFGHEEKIIGLLSADNYHRQLPMTASDAAQLLTYASMVGLTIENTRLYNDLEHQVVQRTAELRVALERAQEADRLKSRFLAAISHELRTPLNAIIGFSTVLLDELDGPITAMQREDLRTIHENGHFLLQLINELLDLARIESGKLELDLAQLDMSELISEVAGTIQGLLRNRPIELRVLAPPGLPLAWADRARLRQILLNLLSNAAKFTERGEIVVSARTVVMAQESADQRNGAETGRHANHDLQADQPAMRRTRPWVAVSIRDTGVGIAADMLPLVFEEFRQVHPGRTGMRGSGLGLAITRGLIEAHGGRIWAESTPGHGTTFTFTVPIAYGTRHARESADPVYRRQPK